MATKVRPSSYRRSYGTDKVALTNTKATAELRKVKEQEKEKLKKCNNRLVNYIEKVNDLENANRALALENAVLRKQGKTTDQTNVAELYDDELKRLREKVEELTVKNAQQEIENDNLKYELEETNEKLEEATEKTKEIEKEVKTLRKDVDDATIERVSLEGKVENLQETLQLERKAHAVELENLRGQIQPAYAPVVENEPSSLMPDLTDAIQSVRQQYESFNSKNMEALGAFYKDKVDSVTKQLKASQEDCAHLRAENGSQRKTIQNLELELEALRSKTDNLERTVADLEDLLAKQASDSDDKIRNLTQELEDAKQDLGKYLKDYQDLENLKLSLDQEIHIYNRLLQGGESKILDVEVADPAHVVRTPQKDKTGSRSRSRSRSASPAKSRSRSSSASSRSASDVVEDMLEADKAENEEKGVVSVTWKVKGGTIRPVEPFNSNDDAEKLRQALKGAGTDENAIISILSKRSKSQRMLISVAYKDKFGEDLIEDLKKDLSGEFLTTVLHLMWARSVMDANALRKAMKGFLTDDAVLIEILCTQSSRDINAIKEAYATEFPGRNLEEDVSKETSGGFRDFLLAVLKANRPPDSGTVVANVAEDDAKALLAMTVKEWTPSNPKFLEIFTERSFEHLWFLFNQSWPEVSKDDLLETINKECKGDLKKGLKALIRFSVYIPPTYYAVQLYDAMKGFGTEDKQVIYIITARSEIDLIDIKEEYGNRYKTALAQRIKGETSGHYRDLLLAIVGEE